MFGFKITVDKIYKKARLGPCILRSINNNNNKKTCLTKNKNKKLVETKYRLCKISV